MKLYLRILIFLSSFLYAEEVLNIPTNMEVNQNETVYQNITAYDTLSDHKDTCKYWDHGYDITITKQPTKGTLEIISHYDPYDTSFEICAANNLALMYRSNGTAGTDTFSIEFSSINGTTVKDITMTINEIDHRPKMIWGEYETNFNDFVYYKAVPGGELYRDPSYTLPDEPSTSNIKLCYYDCFTESYLLEGVVLNEFIFKPSTGGTYYISLNTELEHTKFDDMDRIYKNTTNNQILPISELLINTTYSFQLFASDQDNDEISYIFTNIDGVEVQPNYSNISFRVIGSTLNIITSENFIGTESIGNIQIRAKANNIKSDNYFSLPSSIYIDDDFDDDGILDKNDNDIDNDGVLNTHDSNSRNKLIFYTDRDNDNLIDSTLNTDIFNSIYSSYKFDPDFYTLEESENKSLITISDSKEFNLNSESTSDKLPQFKVKLLNSPTNNSYSSLTQENILSDSLTFNHAEFASLSKSLIYDVSYDQFEPHLIKKYNLVHTYSSSTIALFTSYSAPQIIDGAMQGKLTTSKNNVWLKPDLSSAKKVSKHKLVLKLQDDPNALLKVDNSLGASVKVSVYEGADTTNPLGYKEANASDEIVVDLVLESDKEYLIKIESTNIKQLLFHTALIEQDDIYFEKIKLDANGQLNKNLIIPISGSYELVLNSYKKFDANITKNGTIVTSCADDQFYSKTHLDLNAYQYQLNISGEAGQELDLVFVTSIDAGEIEPNNKVLNATRYKKDISYRGTLTSDDIDIFTINKYFNTISVGNNLNVEIESDNDGVSLDITLIDSYGTIIDEYFGTVTDGKLSYTISIPGGIYYIQLSSASTSDIDYSFSIKNTEFREIGLSRYEQSVAKLYFAELQGELLELDEIVGNQEELDAGNLIILTGDSDNPTDALYTASQKLSKTFYTRFIQRGLTDKDIYWMNYNADVDIDNDGANDNVVDTTEFGANTFYNSITTWAKDTAKEGPLYIYMVDHGANGSFKVSSEDKDDDGIREIVYVNKLVTAVNQFVKDTNRNVYVFIEACKSGSFIPSFAKSEYADKIAVVTSSEAGKLSYIDNFGNVSFTKFVADEILAGKTVYKAYEHALVKLKDQGGVYSRQKPMILAQTDTLKNNTVGGSFSIAGISLTSINSVTVDDVKDATTLDLTSKKNIRVNAKVSADSGVAKVWSTIIPPDFTTILDDNFTTPDLEPYTQELGFNPATNEFEGSWSVLSENTYSGEYQITIYVEDRDGLVFSKNITAQGNGEKEIVPSIVYESYEVINSDATTSIISEFTLDTQVEGDVTIKSGSVILAADVTVSNNFFVQGGSLDLNGYTLTVYGDLNQTAGEIDVNKGKLIILGSSDHTGGTLIQNNKPSIITSVKDLSLNEDFKEFNISISIIDVDGDDLNLSVESNDTSIISIDPRWGLELLNQGEYLDKTLDLNISARENAFGSAQVTLTLQDDEFSASKSFNIVIQSVNDTPIISGIPITLINQDVAYSFIPKVDDNDTTDTHIFSIENKPEWLEFNSTSGELKGTPTNSDVGSYNDVKISVTDNAKATSSLALFDIVVNNSNDLPAIAVVTNLEVGSEGNVSTSFTYIDDDGDTVSATLTKEPLYGNVIVKDNTITFVRSNNDGNQDSFSIVFSDGNGGIVTKEFTVNILEVIPDVTETLQISSGWNLISANLNKQLLPASIKILWQYRYNQWFGYSTDSEINDVLINNGLPLVESIKTQNGTWMLSAIEDNLEIVEGTSEKVIFYKGWNLSGVTTDTNVSKIQCINSEISSLWKYKNETWYLNTPIANNLEFESFDTIYDNEGFWIHCK